MRAVDHETACNIAEDLDNGHIFPWRVEQVKAHLAAGGTTAVVGDELVLVRPGEAPPANPEELIWR